MPTKRLELTFDDPVPEDRLQIITEATTIGNVMLAMTNVKGVKRCISMSKNTLN